MIGFWSKDYKLKRRAIRVTSAARSLFTKNRTKIQPELADFIQTKLGQTEAAIRDGSSSELLLRTEELENINKDHLLRFSKSKLRQNIEALILAVILALIIRTFIVQPFKIPSGSMIPTLLVGDHLLVNKFIYGTKIPFTDRIILPIKGLSRGDVIVFKYPNDENDPSKRGIHYIKRIIGVPGDKIDIGGRNLYINGEKIDLKYSGEYNDERFGTEFDKYEEFLSGNRHVVLFEKGRTDTQKGRLPVEVPPGHVFVMGDNRDNSQDSRFWGFVPIGNIEGKAIVTHWSWDFENDSILNKVRWNRVLSLIN